MRAATRLPKLARILERYLRLFEPAAVERLEFLERSRLKGKRLGQLRTELERIKARRSGGMLVEVLVALLIFLIGAVSCLSLFAVSADRARRAIQLTAATDLRVNAESAIDLHSEIIRNPAGGVPQAGQQPRPFCFDPLGVAVLPAAVAGRYGNLPRHAGNYRTQAAAEALVCDQNSWVVQFEAFGVNATPISIDLPGLGAIGFAVPSRPACRVTLFDAGMKAAQSRDVATVSGNTVAWSTPLPGGFVPARGRIELQDRRYSWLATGRPTDGGKVAVDVVVFSGRSFDPADDLAFPAVFQAGSGLVSVACPIGRTKRGGWILDSDGAWWHRIAQARDLQNGTVAITLETPAAASSPAAGGVAVLPRSVVDVFPIGQK